MKRSRLFLILAFCGTALAALIIPVVLVGVFFWTVAEAVLVFKEQAELPPAKQP